MLISASRQFTANSGNRPEHLAEGDKIIEEIIDIYVKTNTN